MMRDTNAPAAWIRVEAIHALIDIGKPAFSLLTQTLPDTNQPGRSYIVDTIAVRMPEALGTNICVQLLATVLADPDYGVRVAATSGLAFLAPQAMTNNTLRPIPGTVEATNAPAK
jgi:HEAT repeat protein